MAFHRESMDTAELTARQGPIAAASRLSTDSTLAASSDIEAGLALLPHDKEAHEALIAEVSASNDVAAEYSVPTSTKLAHLAAYFTLNLSLTIYNKAVLGGFAFPWLMTAIHCTTVSLGCSGLYYGGYFTISKLGTRENLILVAFSLLFTLNIAVSNISLGMVSVPLHQTLRSTTPAFAIVIYRLVFSRSYSTATYASVVPIIFGAGLATYGDFAHTPLGLFMTLLGVVLGATKSITTNKLMTGSLKLSALEMLLRMSPLAAVQSVLFSFLSGEAARFGAFRAEGHLTRALTLALLGNGLVAFVLNISSLHTNKLVGALTMTISGNLKQCLTILLSIVLFNVKVGPANGLGMAIAAAGAAVYGKVELDSKARQRARPS